MADPSNAPMPAIRHSPRLVGLQAKDESQNQTEQIKPPLGQWQ
jgi:hypothetical protein